MGKTIYGYCENKGKHEVYSKEKVDSILANKAATSHNHDDRYYTETEVNSLLSSHTHDNRYYTETEVNNLLANKSNKEIVLYSVGNGTTGNVSLSDTSSNYEYIEIIYMKNGQIYSTGKIYSPNGRKVHLHIGYAGNDANGEIIQMGYEGCTISEKTIKRGTLYIVNHSFDGTTSAGMASQNDISIIRVIGYK